MVREPLAENVILLIRELQLQEVEDGAEARVGDLSASLLILEEISEVGVGGEYIEYLVLEVGLDEDPPTEDASTKQLHHEFEIPLLH